MAGLTPQAVLDRLCQEYQVPLATRAKYRELLGTAMLLQAAELAAPCECQQGPYLYNSPDSTADQT